MTESDIKYVPYKDAWCVRIKARKCNKNRYDNMIVVVRE